MGKIQTNSVTGSSVSSLVSSKTVPNSTGTKDTVTINDKYDSKTSDSAISSVKIKQASAFVTQTTKQSVVPIKTESDAASKVKNKVNELDEKELNTISKISGQEIKTDGDLESALDKINDDLGQLLSNKNTPLTGDPIIEHHDTAQEELTKATDIQSLTTDNSEYNQQVIDTAQRVNREYPQLPNLSNEMLGDIPDYPNVTDENNALIPGIPADVDFNIVDGMYKVVKRLCPDSDIPSLFNFSFSINLFSGLLSSAAKLGLVDMLQKLIDCVNFYDHLLDDPLKAVTGEVALKGDSRTLSLISSVSGPDIPKKNNKIKDLIKNIKTNDTNDVSSVLSNWHMDKKDVTEKKPHGIDISVKSTTKFKELSSDKNKGFMKSFLGGDNFDLINMVSKNL